jgi:DNA-binding transcriptional MerR regulator
MGYTIKQMSEKTHLSPYVLRYYEKEGLICQVERKGNGIRYYSENDVETLRWICCLKDTGMSIKQIRDFVDLSIKGDTTLKQRCKILTEHKIKIEERIQEMKKHLEKIARKIELFTSKYEKSSLEHIGSPRV